MRLLQTPTKKTFNRKNIMNKYRSLAPRPRVGSAAHALRYRASSSIATGRSVRSGSELDIVVGGSLACEKLDKTGWRTTRWVWPNEEKAKQYGKAHLFEHGEAKLSVSDDAFQKRLVIKPLPNVQVPQILIDITTSIEIGSTILL